MKETFELTLMSRGDTGKGASRRLRHAEQVPGIIYGGDKEPEMVAAKLNELLHHLENEAFYSHILTASVGGGTSQKVVLKDLQRHPSKPILMHFDLLRVSDKGQIKMNVPLHFTGEDSAPGIKHGGNLIHDMTDIEIICEARNLPEFIELDISGMEVGDTLHLTDLVLPEGVQIFALMHDEEHDAPVVAIHAARGPAEEDDEEAGDEAEAGSD